MTALRRLQWALVTLMIVMAAGCTSFERFSSPFGRSSELDPNDPLYANSKAGQVDEIRRIGEQAARQSPAEQMTTSTDLAKRMEQEQDKVLRIELIRALSQYPTPAAVDGLRIAMQDPRKDLRVAACQSLGKVRSPDALAILEAALGADADLDVRIAATRAIGNYDGPQAIRALEPAVSDPDPALQYTAVLAMKELHTEDLGNSVSAWRDLARSIGNGRSLDGDATYVADRDIR